MSDDSHKTDEQLEFYALGRLSEADIAEVEEHLLVCAFCREILDEWDSFALAMHRAIANEPAVDRKDWLAWMRRPVVPWVAGFALVVLAAGLYWNSDRRPIAPLATLQLTAMRGEMPSVAEARQTELTLTDTPSSAGLRMEVVDFAGKSVWAGPLVRGGDRVKLTTPLRPGDYFVRLFDGAGKLLHEYDFRVQGLL